MVNEPSLKKAAESLFSGKANPTDSLRKKLLRHGIDPSIAKNIIYNK